MWPFILNCIYYTTFQFNLILIYYLKLIGIKHNINNRMIIDNFDNLVNYIRYNLILHTIIKCDVMMFHISRIHFDFIKRGRGEWLPLQLVTLGRLNNKVFIFLFCQSLLVVLILQCISSPIAWSSYRMKLHMVSSIHWFEFL